MKSYLKEWKKNNSKLFQVIYTVTFYWVVSMCMVFLNKVLLSYNKLDAPMFLTVTQFTITTLLSVVVYQCTHFQRIDLASQFKDTFYLSILLSGMITCNNLALYHVTVSLFNVVRSLTTVFNVIFMKIILKVNTTIKPMICCLIIISGFMVGCYDGYVSDLNKIYTKDKEKLFKGFLFGVLSSIFNSLYGVISKQKLKKYSNLQVQITLNPTALLIMSPIIFFGNDIKEIKHSNISQWNDINFYYIIVLSGIFGMLVAYATLLQINVTSPLTHNISATAKSYVLTIFAVIIFKEYNHSYLFWISNFLVLSGTLCYAIVKNSEMNEK